MTAKEFLRTISNDQPDVLRLLLDILRETKSAYCVIGGLAVNAYVEPLVSLDLDIVTIAANVDAVCQMAESKGFRIERFAHSVNLSVPKSDLRVQIQTDARYQEFIASAEKRDVLGYEMFVACKEDVALGKTWAYLDSTRRRSKRQKDLTDILRLVEAYPDIAKSLPESVRAEVE